MLPLRSLSHAGSAPEPLGFSGRVLQALLDLDPLVGSNQLAHDKCVTNRRVESLVSATLTVEHIFTDDPPVSQCEGVMPEYLVGVP
jgi:hypothetical protein